MARKRSHRRRRYSNPLSVPALLSKPKEMISKEFVFDAATTAAGFIVPGIAMNYLPVAFRDSRVKFYVSKVATIAVLSTAAGMISKKAAKTFLIGGGVSLLLDLWTEFRARTATPAPAPAGGTGMWYGPGMDYYYGGMQGLGESGGDSETDAF